MLFISTNEKYKDFIKDKFDGAKVVSSVADLDIRGEDVLIYHSCSDDISKVSLTLSYILKNIGKRIYVNSSLDSVICTLFMGVDGDIYDTEDCLEDIDLLNYYIDSYKETGACFEFNSDSLSVIQDAFKYLCDASPADAIACLQNPDWRATLDEAFHGCTAIVASSTQIANPIQEILSQSWDIINKLRESNDALAQNFEKLSEEYKRSKFSSNTGGDMYVFPTFDVPVTCKTIYVKVLAPCMFLNSFFDAFQDWCRVARSKNLRCLLVTPNMKQYINKYRDVDNLNSNSIKKGEDFWDKPWYVTHKPTYEVLKAFFEKSARRPINGYIVIDWTFGDTLLRGSMVSDYYAVSSVGDIKAFDISNDPQDSMSRSHTFVPLIPLKGALNLKQIPNYSYAKNPQTGETVKTTSNIRHKNYNDNYSELFNTLIQHFN